MVELYCGDCLDIMPMLPAGSVDLVLTDPRYGTTACTWDSVIPFEPMWGGIKHGAKRNAAIVLFGSQPFTSALICSNINSYKATWYWKKERGTNFVQAKRYPMKVREDCVLFCYGTNPTYNPAMKTVKPYKRALPLPKRGSAQHMDSKSVDAEGNRIVKEHTKAYPINLLEIPRDNMRAGRSLHPTQKPVALMEYLIRTYTNEGDTVLDFTMGSGTTGVACVNTGRKFIGIEMDAKYFEIAQRRIEAAQMENL